MLALQGSEGAVHGALEIVWRANSLKIQEQSRSFTLSSKLDPGKIKAKLSNGVLTLHIPKAEQASPRRINVTVG